MATDVLPHEPVDPPDDGAWPDAAIVEPPGSPCLVEWLRAWNDVATAALRPDDDAPGKNESGVPDADDGPESGAFGVELRLPPGRERNVVLVAGGILALFAAGWAIAPLIGVALEGFPRSAWILSPVMWGLACASFCGVIGAWKILAHRSRWLFDPSRLRWRMFEPWGGSWGSVRRDAVKTVTCYNENPLRTGLLPSRWAVALRMDDGSLRRLPMPGVDGLCEERHAVRFAARLAEWARVPVERRETRPDDPMATPDRFRVFRPGDAKWRRARQPLTRGRTAPLAADARILRVSYSGRDWIATSVALGFGSAMAGGAAVLLWYMAVVWVPTGEPARFLTQWREAMPWGAILLMATAGLTAWRLAALFACRTAFLLEPGRLTVRNSVSGLGMTRTWLPGDLRAVRLLPQRRRGRVCGWTVRLEDRGGETYAPLFEGRLLAMGIGEVPPALLQYTDAEWLAFRLAGALDLPVRAEASADGVDDGMVVVPTAGIRDRSGAGGERPLSSPERWVAFTRRVVATRPVSTEAPPLPPGSPVLAALYRRFGPHGTPHADPRAIGLRFDARLSLADGLLVMAMVAALIWTIAPWVAERGLHYPPPFDRWSWAGIAAVLALWLEGRNRSRNWLGRGCLWLILTPERLVLAAQQGVRRESCRWRSLDRAAVRRVWLYRENGGNNGQTRWFVDLIDHGGRRIKPLWHGGRRQGWDECGAAKWFAGILAEWAGVTVETFEPGDGRPFPHGLSALDPETGEYARACRILTAAGAAPAPEDVVVERHNPDRLVMIGVGVLLLSLVAVFGGLGLVATYWPPAGIRMEADSSSPLMGWLLGIGAVVVGAGLLVSELYFQAGRCYLMLAADRLVLRPGGWLAFDRGTSGLRGLERKAWRNAEVVKAEIRERRPREEWRVKLHDADGRITLMPEPDEPAPLTCREAACWLSEAIEAWARRR